MTRHLDQVHDLRAAIQRRLGGCEIVAFINELHYDNDGTDSGEAIEVAATAGADLSGYQLVLYNGAATSLSPYDTLTLSGVVADAGAGFGFMVVNLPSNGLQNGPPDGIALVAPDGAVLELLSYEGTFQAASGPAAGMTSTDIGVAETATPPIGHSLQRTGTGRVASDFSWAEPGASTFGATNTGQLFGDPPPPSSCGEAATKIHEDDYVDERLTVVVNLRFCARKQNGPHAAGNESVGSRALN